MTLTEIDRKVLRTMSGPYGYRFYTPAEIGEIMGGKVSEAGGDREAKRLIGMGLIEGRSVVWGFSSYKITAAGCDILNQDLRRPGDENQACCQIFAAGENAAPASCHVGSRHGRRRPRI